MELRRLTQLSLEDVDKAHAGTDIVLHVSEDAKEYLAQDRIREILNTYCKFMPVEIVQGTKSEYVDDPEGATNDEGNVKKVSVDVPFVVNKTEPAWTKKPADLQDEDYAEFYRDLYPMNFEDPLFHIHLNVDFPST